MDRFICIHGHYYQPPRENPWLESIEMQDSAYPYHDWNERITAECYEPNANSRILDGDGRINKIVNNYAHTSFNVGPTLLSWMEEHAPSTYAHILEADCKSQQLFSGHGSALAQTYNHMIMPLASARDKLTQVLWGIRDFEFRFRRSPAGMWLAETAVDTETLEILAENDIQFTVLAPRQAKDVRRLRSCQWQDVSHARIDPTMPYEIRLPSGRTIVAFFYDGPISRAVAFEGLLARGEFLAGRLAGAFSEERDWAQLVHIATDGETYGHHHRQGDMALAYALHHITKNDLAQITNYGEFLANHPPTHEARTFDDSSWSCDHGVERWRSDCGCNTGSRPEWNQRWRGPLRAAFDWLRDELAVRYEAMGRQMFHDPWKARDSYIDVVLDRSDASMERFFDRHSAHRLGAGVTCNALQLLEMQRHCMLMYTSCGWFFDELSGIETIQVMHYGARAIQLAEYLFDEQLEPPFCERLAEAKSNLPEHQDGRHIYEKFVRPSRIGLSEVGAHFAVSSLFEDYKEQNKLYCYTTNVGDFQVQSTGTAKLAVGHVMIESDITRQQARLSFGVIHWGDHNLHGGVRAYEGEEAYQTFVRQVTEAFQHAEFPMVVRLLDQKVQASTYSLRSLFRDEQRKILNIILDAGPAEGMYRQLFEQSAPIMSFLGGLGPPSPKAFQMAAEYVLNLDLKRALEDKSGGQRVQDLFDQARLWRVPLDLPGLGYLLERRIRHSADALREADVQQEDTLDEVTALVTLATSIVPDINLRPAQNVFYDLSKGLYPSIRQRALDRDASAQIWVDGFLSLGKLLGVRVEQ